MNNFALHYRPILRFFCSYRSCAEIIKPLCIMKGKLYTSTASGIIHQLLGDLPFLSVKYNSAGGR